MSGRIFGDTRYISSNLAREHQESITVRLRSNYRRRAFARKRPTQLLQPALSRVLGASALTRLACPGSLLRLVFTNFHVTRAGDPVV